MRRRLGKPATGYHLLVHLLVCLSLTAAALAVALAVNHHTERKFCDVIAQSVRQAERQVEGLRESPPTTPAGESIRRGWAEAVQQYRQLERDLGCPTREAA